jgi:DNA-binding response OmpR family regulator
MNTKIVIFDDSPSIQLLFRHILTHYGYTVFTLEEDETGLEQAQALQADLIILGNIRSNHERGFQFLTKLRAQMATSATPVIIATTAAPHLLKSPLLVQEETHVSVLFKPFNHRQLLDQIEGGLKGSQRERTQTFAQEAVTATSYH